MTTTVKILPAHNGVIRTIDKDSRGVITHIDEKTFKPGDPEIVTYITTSRQLVIAETE